MNRGRDGTKFAFAHGIVIILFRYLKPMTKQKNTHKPLTAKETLFADYMIAHPDCTQLEAYRHAYKTKDTDRGASRNAYSILNRPHVKAYIEAAKAEARNEAILSRQEALAILTEISRGQLVDLLDDYGNIDPAKIKKAGRALESYENITGNGENSDTRIKAKIRDPISAIDRIAKLEGWDKQKDLNLDGVVFNLNLSGEKK